MNFWPGSGSQERASACGNADTVDRSSRGDMGCSVPSLLVGSVVAATGCEALCPDPGRVYSEQSSRHGSADALCLCLDDVC